MGGQECVVLLVSSKGVRRVMTQTCTVSDIACKDSTEEAEDADDGLTLSPEDTLD